MEVMINRRPISNYPNNHSVALLGTLAANTIEWYDSKSNEFISSQSLFFLQARLSTVQSSTTHLSIVFET